MQPEPYSSTIPHNNFRCLFLPGTSSSSSVFQILVKQRTPRFQIFLPNSPENQLSIEGINLGVSASRAEQEELLLTETSSLQALNMADASSRPLQAAAVLSSPRLRERMNLNLTAHFLEAMKNKLDSMEFPFA